MSGADAHGPAALRVVAPCPGTVIGMAQVPDRVFAAEMVGPGVAIAPPHQRMTVHSPVDGTVVKVHPHAFVVVTPDGTGILVHLGIDTNRLSGRGFEVHATERSTVAVGDAMVTWDPAEVAAAGLSTVVPVVVMDAPKGSVSSPLEGRRAATGDLLFTLG